MNRLLRRLWAEERGTTSVEWALVVTVLVLGAITGLAARKPLPPVDQGAPPPALVR